LQASNTILSQYQPNQIELNEFELKLEYVITYTRNANDYAIAIVVHDKHDHSNALITIDFLSKKEYKQFNHTDKTSFIKPDRLPNETLTNAIVTKAVKSTKDAISTCEIIGVLRWNESPNAEKNIVIVKAEDGQYWIIVVISNAADGVEGVQPIIEEYKTIEVTIITTIVTKIITYGPSEEVVKDSEEVESVTSGVIHDGEAYQVDHNVKEDKLSK